MLPVLLHFQGGGRLPVDFDTVDESIVDELLDVVDPSGARLGRGQSPLGVVIGAQGDDSA